MFRSFLAMLAFVLVSADASACHRQPVRHMLAVVRPGSLVHRERHVIRERQHGLFAFSARLVVPTGCAAGVCPAPMPAPKVDPKKK